jgi:hypothetical protein
MKTKAADDALLNCPCCGSSERTTITGKIVNRKIWKVFCPDCQIRTGPEYTLTRAIEVWNTRGATIGQHCEWVNIEDKRPEPGSWMFVSDGIGTHFAAYIEHLGFLGTEGEAFDSCVKYWMPLPKPPT